MASTTAPRARVRRDLCPGVLRPWIADDGALVRLRLVGGRLPAASLRGLLDVAERYGDGAIHLTKRANLQLRALPHLDGTLPDEVVDTITATGLVPAPSHELVRNVMVSPGSGAGGTGVGGTGAGGTEAGGMGAGGGRADLRPVAEEVDRRLRADPALAQLPGRFLFVLDDGRGDLVGRSCDLGLVALDEHTAQVRLGSAGWGPVVPLGEAPHVLVGLARLFLRVRGEGPTAPWHVDELDDELDHVAAATDPRVPPPGGTLPFGDGPAGRHLPVPGGCLTRSLAEDLLRLDTDLVVTPWHGVLCLREVAP